ncbi:MAG: hypothetical protein KF847_16505 [Pirellulales bacterium]|nr:hypothetical protein [Pirellulales bacterium]
MNHWKFWNNPLVVSAMRIKYRKGSPGFTASLYGLALIGLGAILHYADQQNRGLPIPLSRAYLLGILGIQFVVSGAVTLFSVAGSMTAEVANRTLDFQRIVSLSPRQIMLGKMIGEPAMGYFFALATVPLAVLCWHFGAASAGAVLLLYVNLATFTLMAAALGLMHTLVIPENSANKNRGSFAGAFIVFPILLVQLVVANAASRGGLLDNPWVAAPAGLLTPVLSLMHLAQGNSWGAVVSLWGVHVPSLVAAPIVQLAVAASVTAAMARRLRSTLDPPLKRSRVYEAVAAVDLVAAGVCVSEAQAGTPLSEEVYRYCLVHLIACLVVTLAGTPSREALASWIWRDRGKRLRWNDWLWGDRSPALAMYAALAIEGVAVFALAAWAPVRLSQGPPIAGTVADLGAPLVATGVVATAISALYQSFSAAAGKYGRSLALFLIALLAVVPPLASSALIEFRQISRAPGGPADLILGMSPATYLMASISRGSRPPIPAVLPIVMYSGVLLLAVSVLRRWLAVQTALIDRKLAAMGIAPPSPPASGEIVPAPSDR